MKKPYRMRASEAGEGHRESNAIGNTFAERQHNSGICTRYLTWRGLHERWYGTCIPQEEIKQEEKEKGWEVELLRTRECYTQARSSAQDRAYAYIAGARTKRHSLRPSLQQ